MHVTHARRVHPMGHRRVCLWVVEFRGFDGAGQVVHLKTSWAYILRDHSKHEISRHQNIITTVWEVMQGQTPDAIETIVLQDCLKRPERY
jgi:hypothetical protein